MTGEHIIGHFADPETSLQEIITSGGLLISAVDVCPKKLDVQFLLELRHWLADGTEEIVLCSRQEAEIATDMYQTSPVYIGAGYLYVSGEGLIQAAFLSPAGARAQ